MNSAGLPTNRNRDASKVLWQFTTAEARTKATPPIPTVLHGRRTTFDLVANSQPPRPPSLFPVPSPVQWSSVGIKLKAAAPACRRSDLPCRQRPARLYLTVTNPALRAMLAADVAERRLGSCLASTTTFALPSHAGIYWCQATAMKLLGDTPFAARLPSALAGVLTAAHFLPLSPSGAEVGASPCSFGRYSCWPPAR